MRSILDGRARRALIALSAITVFVPATAAVAASGGVAVPAAPAASTATASAFTVSLSDRSLSWGQAVTVHGRAVGATPGAAAVLQFSADGRTWRNVATATLGAKGAYRFHTKLPGRGAVRVALAGAATAATRATDAPAGVTSKAHAIRVHATFSLATRQLQVTAGHHAVVAGHVNPRRAGRLVVALRHTGSHWTKVASDRTDHNGAYRLSWRPGQGGTVRVVAGSDAVASGATRTAGRSTVLHPQSALASRYDDYGSALACSNGTLGYDTMGVANKSLPCGTKVTISYHGRTVTVPVIDRGPYVGNREFDLTGATARALGFDGVGTIRWSVA